MATKRQNIKSFRGSFGVPSQDALYLDTNMSKIGPGTTILASGADIPVSGTSGGPKMTLFELGPPNLVESP